MITSKNRLVLILATAAALLSVPAIAMLFTAEVQWDLFDFIVAGVLLFGTGLTIELVLRKVKTTRNRVIVTGIILFLLFLVWAELAVGVFGTPFAGS